MKASISDQYDYHLAKLHHRNRYLQSVKKKQSSQMELEEREKGFSIYLNGANSTSTNVPIRPSPAVLVEQKRISKTADPYKRIKPSETTRSTSRRGWSQSSVELRTNDGELLHITAPGVFNMEDEEREFEESARLEQSSDNTFDDDSIEEQIEEEGNEIGDIPIESFNDVEPSNTEVSLPKLDSVIKNHLPVTEDYLTTNTTMRPTSVRTLSAVSRKPSSTAIMADSLSDELLEALNNENKLVTKNSRIHQYNIETSNNNNSTHYNTSGSPAITHLQSSFAESDGVILHEKKESLETTVHQVEHRFEDNPCVNTEEWCDSLNVPNDDDDDESLVLDSEQNISSVNASIHQSCAVNDDTINEAPDQPKSTADNNVSDKMQQVISFLTANAEKLTNNQHEQLLNVLTKTPTTSTTATASHNTTIVYESSHEDEFKTNLSVSSSSDSRPRGDTPLPSWFTSLEVDKSQSSHEVTLSPWKVQSSSPSTGLRDESVDHDSRSPPESLISPTDDVPVRLRTAVVMQGRRTIQTESQTYIVPSVDDESLHEQVLHSSSAILQPLSTTDCLDPRASVQKFEYQKWETMREDVDDFVEEGVNIVSIDTDSQPSDDWVFPLPELPQGSELIFKILSTWGDRHYVGLTGIEVFTASGEKAEISKISAFPPDINILPEYSNDPRVVTNLIDGVNQTRDDLHMWLTPFQPYHNHVVQLSFDTVQTVSVIRIWNYNKSRIHSFRGVRDIEIILDGNIVFKGEIHRASGSIDGGIESLSETILFTTDEDILYDVAVHDPSFPMTLSLHDGEENVPRPPTGGSTKATSPTASQESNPRQMSGDSSSSVVIVKGQTNHSAEIQQDNVKDVVGKRIVLCLLSSWSGSQRVGLDRFILLDSFYNPILLKPSNISVCSGMDSVDVETLISTNDTIHSCSQWFTCTPPDMYVSINVTLDEPLSLGGLRVWNSTNNINEGVKFMKVLVDGGQVFGGIDGFLVRKGPCSPHYDYGQLLNFKLESENEDHCNDSNLPSGFVYQLRLLSSWGDPYYIGLTGLQLLDEHNSPIILSKSSVSAHPSSVNVLENVSDDVRTPDKLIDDINSIEDYEHMWLSPILPATVNTVYIVFDVPHTVAGVRLWNYGKTPSRGVKEFSVLVDGLLVYTGLLPIASLATSGILPTIAPPLRSHVFNFKDTTIHEDNYHRIHVEYGRNSVIVTDNQLTNQTSASDVPGAVTTAKTNLGIRPLTALTSNFIKKL